MAKEKKSEAKNNKFSLVKKIGISFIIPIFLAVLGCLLVFSVGWNYISTSINLSSLLFMKEEVNLNRYKFEVNNKEIEMPYNGDKFAVLKIESVGLQTDVYQGDDEAQLIRGIGHSLYSTLPGQGGNVVLCAHRDGYFAPLEYVNLGDEVIVETGYGKYYYEIDDIWIAEIDDMTVTAPSEEERITMYTCYPFNYVGSAPQRYIVEGKFVKVEG